MDRAALADFLRRRRELLRPEDVGLGQGPRRRTPGLRREEVAVLAGVSIEWYTRLEKGHISGVSEEVLDAVAAALRLDEAEHTYLFDLARAARPARRAPRRISLPTPAATPQPTVAAIRAPMISGFSNRIATRPREAQNALDTPARAACSALRPGR